MPTLEQNRGIKEYYEEIKDKYPDISFEKIFNACKHPGIYIKSCIKNNRLPVIHIKYLGKFRVFKSSVLKQLSIELRSVNKGVISQEYYNQNLNFYTLYMKELKEKEEEKDNDTED